MVKSQTLLSSVVPPPSGSSIPRNMYKLDRPNIYVCGGRGSWKGSHFNQVRIFGVTSVTFLIWDTLPPGHQILVLTRNQILQLLRMI